jgi:uncharacterized membrane protein
MSEDGPWWERAAKAVHHALGEFLAVPIAVVAVFLLLAAGVYFIDAAFWSSNQKPPSQLRWLSDVFGDSTSLSSLLSTIATSLITVTSITFSLLLVAVQQAASSLTNQVFDQFLRRRGNQIYFGFFVGLSVFALVNLVVASQSHRPIFGALIAVLLTGVALCLIVVLIYTTIDQMRPDTIIEAIRVHVLSARENQLRLLQATRRTASQTLRVARQVVSERQGYVTAVGVDQIARAVADIERNRKSASEYGSVIEVELCVAVGSHVAFGDPLADLRCDGDLADAGALAKAIVAAITLDNARDFEHDPAFGIAQLAVIGWTSVSTARSNPNPGILVCHALRDILVRWLEQGEAPEDCSSPIVYADRVTDDVISTFESLAVVASESMQHQTLAEIMRTLAMLLPRLPPEGVDQVASVVLRSLSALGEHVLTRELERSLQIASQALAAAGRNAVAEAVTRATDALRGSVGVLNSRSTRVPAVAQSR